jgi:eukaryotic-like serine/threonine-protein kinase
VGLSGLLLWAKDWPCHRALASSMLTKRPQGLHDTLTDQSSVPDILALTPGTNFAGRFVVERLLGVGGMGVVFAARHLELDEIVAVKVMLPEIAANADTAARFQREARACVRIKSDHVARVLDVSRLEDGTPYMVMEYLEGSNIEEHLRRQGPFDVESAVGCVIQACDAIAAAHAVGIVHRDIKPQNLFRALQGDGSYRIKVLDFGISKVSSRLAETEEKLTKTSCAMGSPVYMAPEQMESAKDVDTRADIWGLGCVLFELLVGRPPFRADTMPELCAAVLKHPAPAPSSLRSDLPAQLDQIVLRCLEKSPSARFVSVGELAQALLPFAPLESDVVARIGRRRSTMPPAAAAAQHESVAPPPETPVNVSARPATGAAVGNTSPNATLPAASHEPAELGVEHHTQTNFGQKTTGATTKRSRLAIWLGLPAVMLVGILAASAWLRTGPGAKRLAQPDAAVVSVGNPLHGQPTPQATTAPDLGLAPPSASVEIVPLANFAEQSASAHPKLHPETRRAPSPAPTEALSRPKRPTTSNPTASSSVQNSGQTARPPSLTIELK